MSDFTHDISFMKELDPSGRLEAWARRFMLSHKNVADQVNAAQVGETPAPPAPSAITLKIYSPGVHQVQIHDSNPLNRGAVYHTEIADNPEFNNPILVASGPSKDVLIPAGAGNTFARVATQYPTSPPSQPTYHGTAIAPLAVNAGGNARIPISGAGSGTEPILQPQGAAGFGFENARTGTGTLPRE